MFRVLNANPVSVSILSYETTLPEIELDLAHVSPSPDHMDVVEYGKIYTSDWKIPSPISQPDEDSHNVCLRLWREVKKEGGGD